MLDLFKSADHPEAINTPLVLLLQASKPETSAQFLSRPQILNSYFQTYIMPDKNPMSQSDASRIQSSQAKGGGDMSSGGFAARAQSGAANNTNSGPQNTGTQGTNNTGAAGGKK